MIPFDSKSYPYLAIAQHYEIDYGEVLKFVDQLDNHCSPIMMFAWQVEARNKWLSLGYRKMK